MIGWPKHTRDCLLHRDALAKWPTWIYLLRGLHLATAGIGAFLLVQAISLYLTRPPNIDRMQPALYISASVYAVVVLCSVLLDRRRNKTANTVVFYTLVAPAISLVSISMVLMALTSVLMSLFFISYVVGSLVPAQVAAVSIPERDITVELELYSASPIGKAEYNRRLTVWNGTESATFDLFIDWGGADRVALYFDGRRCLMALGVVDTIRVDVDDFAGLRRCQAYRPPHALDTNDYLGNFMLFSTYPDGERQQHFDFVPRALFSECLETLMESSESDSPDPLGRFQPNCPEFTPETWPLGNR